MERKHFLNQLEKRFDRVVQNPVNAMCLDNPDALLICDHGLVGVFLPTVDTDHLLRRLWLSRMVYTEQMMPLVVLDEQHHGNVNIQILEPSFGNLLTFENLDDTVRFINGRVDTIKGVSQKVRQDAFLNYYDILNYFREKQAKPL